MGVYEKGRKRNAIQYLYGDTNEVEFPVIKVKPDACNEIAVGDPVFYTYTATSAGKQYKIQPIGVLATASVDDARANFAGIAMGESKDGEDNDIRVATTGVFEFPCSSATVKPGYHAVPVTSAGAGAGSVDVDSITPTAPTGAYVNTLGTCVSNGTTQTTCKVKIATKIIHCASVNCLLA